MALPVAVCWAGLGWFNPEALDLLLSSGPPPLRCTRPAGYGSSICVKADKSPRSPVKTSHTNLGPSHILALLHNLLLLSPAPPSSPRVSPSSLVSAYHQKYFDSSSSSCCSSIKSPGTCITIQQVLQVPVPRERERERKREKRGEDRKRFAVDCVLLVLDRVRRRAIRNLQSPTAQIILIRACTQRNTARCKRLLCSPTPERHIPERLYPKNDWSSYSTANPPPSEAADKGTSEKKGSPTFVPIPHPLFVYATVGSLGYPA